jgi:hypothetical protein
MPLGNETIQEASATFRGLLYGMPKTKKTWWAMTAAMAGFNVLFLDGDKGHEIINKMPEDAKTGKWKHRVRIIACSDTLKKPVFCDFATRFLDGKTIKWDDHDNRILALGEQPNPEHAHFVLEAAKLTSNDVLVTDSLSSMVVSLNQNFYNETSMDMTKVNKEENTRGCYEYSGRLLNFMISKLKGLSSHSVLIAHEGIHEVTTPAKNDKTGKWDRAPTGEVNTIIQSSSRNHAASIAGNFSDVLYFNMHGNTHYIDARPSEHRVGGSRSLNKEFMLSDLSLGQILNELGHHAAPDSDMPGCIYYAPGELQGSVARAVGSTIAPNAQKTVGFQLGKPAVTS